MDRLFVLKSLTPHTFLHGINTLIDLQGYHCHSYTSRNKVVKNHPIIVTFYRFQTSIP